MKLNYSNNNLNKYEMNRINSIIYNNNISYFKKLQRYNDLQLNNKVNLLYNDKLFIQHIHKLLNDLWNNEEEKENELLSSEIAIPITNVNDLFGKRFERKLKLFKNIDTCYNKGIIHNIFCDGRCS